MYNHQNWAFWQVWWFFDKVNLHPSFYVKPKDLFILQRLIVLIECLQINNLHSPPCLFNIPLSFLLNHIYSHFPDLFSTSDVEMVMFSPTQKRMFSSGLSDPCDLAHLIPNLPFKNDDLGYPTMLFAHRFSSAFDKVSTDSPNFSVWGLSLTLWDCLPLSDFCWFSLLSHHTTMCSFMCLLCLTAFPFCLYVFTQFYSIVVRFRESRCFMSLKKKVRKAHHIWLCLVSGTSIHREGTWVSLSNSKLCFISYLSDFVCLLAYLIKPESL